MKILVLSRNCRNLFKFQSKSFNIKKLADTPFIPRPSININISKQEIICYSKKKHIRTFFIGMSTFILLLYVPPDFNNYSYSSIHNPVKSNMLSPKDSTSLNILVGKYTYTWSLFKIPGPKNRESCRRLHYILWSERSIYFS